MINTDNKMESFNVTGMSCASCAMNVENLLKSQPGVNSANVNLASNSVFIDYNSNLVQPLELKEKLKKIGFDLLIEKDNKINQDGIEEIEAKEFNQLKKTCISLWDSPFQ
ncbi:MAG: heavy metal-associated domain-containing protein [Saprospiraceae bacterium]